MLDPIHPHEDGVPRIDAIAESGVEVSGDRQPVLVRDFDQGAELLRTNPLRLEGSSSSKRPIRRFSSDRVGRHRFVAPSGAGGSPVGTRTVDARTGKLARSDAFPAPAGLGGIDFPRREGGRDAVGHEEHRVDRVLVDPTLPEEVDRVVGVQVEDARHDEVALVEEDRLGAAPERLELADAEDRAIADQNARIRTGTVTRPVPQASPENDEITFLGRWALRAQGRDDEYREQRGTGTRDLHGDESKNG